MNSALYTGTIQHRRSAPKDHRFRYRLFMMYLDTAELDTVFARRWLWSARRPALAWFRRADFLGPAESTLDSAVRERVEAETGRRPRGPIRILTHLRYFGYVSNPVTFYYCFSEDESALEAIVAEITNTPWGERHAYVLTSVDNVGSPERHRYKFDKSFHVSPFMDMAIQYEWTFTVPGTSLGVHMENRNADGPIFDASLSLRRKEITGASLALVLATYPFMTVRVVTGIYWQALKLWLKRAPIYPHPASAES